MRDEPLSEEDRALVRRAAAELFNGDPIECKLLEVIRLMVALDPQLAATRETLFTTMTEKLRISMDRFFD